MKNKLTKIITLVVVVALVYSTMFVSYGDPAKIVKGTQNGLAVKLYGSSLGTLGLWKDANFYGITRSSSGRFSIVDSYNQFLLLSDRNELKRLNFEGFIVPKYSEKYNIKVNSEIANDTLIWLDDSIIYDKGKVYDVELEADKDYHIEIEVVNKGYDTFKLLWSSDSQENSIVPEESLFVPNTFGGSEISQYNPNGDIDNDGIPNSWEKNGYCVLDYGIIVPYDESLGLKKFVTDFDEASTDLDPYTDFEEATGIGMDRSVTSPGNDPLVPAYPEVSFVTTGVTVVRNETNTTGQSISSSNSTQNIAGVVDTDGTGTGTKENAFKNVNAGVTAKYEAAGTEAKATVTVSVDSKFGQGKTDTKHIETSTDTIDKNVVGDGSSTGNDESTTVDTANYAQLIISGYYLNHGTAPIYNLDPVVSLTIGSEDYQVTMNSKVLKTFKVEASQRPTVIAPKSKYPLNGELVLDLTGTGEGALPGPIMLTKEQTELIESGVPFGVTISMNRGDVKKIVDPEDNQGNYFKNIGTWNTYLNAINNNSAVVSLKIPGSARVSRRIFTGGQKKPTLLDALEMLYDAEYENGKLYVEGEEVNFSEWQFDFTGKNTVVNNIIKALNGGSKLDFTTIQLQDNMGVDITKSDSKATPLVLSSYFEPINEKFHAVVIPTGNNAISKVEAKISRDGKESTIKMTKDSSSDYSYVSDSITNLDIGFNNQLIVTAQNGVKSTKHITVDESYLKSQARKGLSFKNVEEMGVTDNKAKVVDYETASAWKERIVNNPDWKQFTVSKGSQGLGYKYDVYDLNDDGRLNANKIFNISYTNRITDWPDSRLGWNFSSNHLHYLDISKAFSDMRATNKYINVAYFDSNHWSYIVGFTKNSQYIERDLPSKLNNYRGYYRVFEPTNIKNIKRYTVYGNGWGNYGDDIISQVDLYKGDTKVRSNIGISVKSGSVDLRSALPGIDKVKLKSIMMYKTNTDVTTSTIIDRDTMLEYIDNLISGKVYERILSVDGTFADNTNKVFVRTNGSSVELSSGTKSIIAPNPKADTILYSVTSHRDGNRIDNHVFNLDTWQWGDRYDDTEELMFITKRNEEDSIPTDIKNSVKTNTIGYFIDREDVTDNNFWQYWTPSKPLRYTLMPDFNDGNNSATWTIDYNNLKVKGYPVKPKGFLIKVNQDAELKKLEVTINNQLHSLSISSDSKVKKGNLIYVDANRSNPFDISISQNINGEHLTGNYDFGDISYEIVGYFYDGNM